jgi:uncharacterized membrane protein
VKRERKIHAFHRQTRQKRGRERRDKGQPPPDRCWRKARVWKRLEYPAFLAVMIIFS